MIQEYIDSQKYLKRKMGEELTKDEKKLIENGKLQLSFYASEYLYYKVIK